MNSEDHIHFLSELLQQIDELLSMVREYCDEIVRNDNTEHYPPDRNNRENVPF